MTSSTAWILRTLDVAALVGVVATYWTIEIYYSWFKAYGNPSFDEYYSYLAYGGIAAAFWLFARVWYLHRRMRQRSGSQP